MLKSQLIDKLSDEAKNLSSEDIETVVRTIFDAMSNSLAHQHRIEIRGFGSFAPKKRRQRIAHNPKTGIKVTVPEKWVPFFVPGKELRERVNHA